MPQWMTELIGVAPAAVAVIIVVYMMLQFMGNVNERHAESMRRKDDEAREALGAMQKAHMKACDDTIQVMRDINVTLGRVDAHIQQASEIGVRLDRHLSIADAREQASAMARDGKTFGG